MGYFRTTLKPLGQKWRNNTFEGLAMKLQVCTGKGGWTGLNRAKFAKFVTTFCNR